MFYNNLLLSEKGFLNLLFVRDFFEPKAKVQIPKVSHSLGKP